MASNPQPSHEQTAYGFGQGCIPDSYDHNDKLLSDLYGMQNQDMKDVYDIIVEKAQKRTKMTLEASCPPVFNQYAIGSCVANATIAALRFAWRNTVLNMSRDYAEFNPSRLWVYYYARLLLNNRKDLEFRDSGCEIRDALKVLKNKGVCEEKAWEYLTEAEANTVQELQIKTKDSDAMPSDCRAGIVPPAAKDENATKALNFDFDYHRIRSLSDDNDKATAAETVINQMCACLSEGYPIVFGFVTFWDADGQKREFHNDANWVGDVFNVDALGPRGKPSGSHAVLCVGFDRNRKLFRIQNSWGEEWRDKGYFWMPFSWFERAHATSDLWTIRPHLAPLLRDHDPIE